jgi:hypothetical protein
MAPEDIALEMFIAMSVLFLHYSHLSFITFLLSIYHAFDRLCGLVVRVLGYRSGGPGSIPGTIRKKVVVLERGPPRIRP